MQAKIDMIGIITSNLEEMTAFYRDVLGFTIKLQMESYIEFEHPGVRFALSTHDIMAQATGLDEYADKKHGHNLELAFRSDSPGAVDTDFAEIIAKGAVSIKEPSDMPWGQRTAFFADPDGNVHEIFADLPQE